MDMTIIISWWFTKNNQEPFEYQKWLDRNLANKTIETDGFVVGFFCLEDTEAFN